MSGFAAGYLPSTHSTATSTTGVNQVDVNISARGFELLQDDKAIDADKKVTLDLALPNWSTIASVGSFFALLLPLEAMAYWIWATSKMIEGEGAERKVVGPINEAFWWAIVLSALLILIGWGLKKWSAGDDAEKIAELPSVKSILLSMAMAPGAFVFWAVIENKAAVDDAIGKSPDWTTKLIPDSAWGMAVVLVVGVVLSGFGVPKLRDE